LALRGVALLFAVFASRTCVRYRNATLPFSSRISHSWRLPRKRHKATAPDGAHAPTGRRAVPNRTTRRSTPARCRGRRGGDAAREGRRRGNPLLCVVSPRAVDGSERALLQGRRRSRGSRGRACSQGSSTPRRGRARAGRRRRPAPAVGGGSFAAPPYSSLSQQPLLLPRPSSSSASCSTGPTSNPPWRPRRREGGGEK
jgi:hypothetical protein